MKIGLPQIFSGMLAAGFTSFFLSWCTQHGIDFSAFGTDAETVKSAMIGGLTGTLIGVVNLLQGLTPRGVVDKIISVITFFRKSAARIAEAACSPLKGENK